MSKTLTCRVVTPTQELLSSEISYASVPAWDGLFGVLPGHAPMVAELGTGELKLEFPSGNGGDRSYLVDGGFVKVDGSDVTILAEFAVPAEELNETEAKAELAEAEARQVPADAPDKAAEADRVRRARDRARVAVRLAQTARTRGI
ncbi:MAG: F-type H+-transporting ATPase subunit epsilon [Phycisphaerales bacterium]